MEYRIEIWLFRIGNQVAKDRLARGTSDPVPIQTNRTEEVLPGEKISPVLIDIVFKTMLN
jgi:hypothetical protein